MRSFANGWEVCAVNVNISVRVSVDVNRGYGCGYFFRSRLRELWCPTQRIRVLSFAESLSSVDLGLNDEAQRRDLQRLCVSSHGFCAFASRLVLIAELAVRNGARTFLGD